MIVDTWLNYQICLSIKYIKQDLGYPLVKEDPDFLNFQCYFQNKARLGGFKQHLSVIVLNKPRLGGIKQKLTSP